MVHIHAEPPANRPIRFNHWGLLLCLSATLALMTVASRKIAGQEQAEKPAPRKPISNSPKEPLAGTLSLSRSAAFLDRVTLAWLRERKCASCHTGYPYLLARAACGDPQAPAMRQVRTFFEDRVGAWDQGGKGSGYLKGNGPLKVSEGVTEIVAVAATLAIDDAQSTGKLHPRTRQALDRIWEVQQQDGSWPWNNTRLAPLECDAYFGAVYAALGVGYAPGGYAHSATAKEGLARLQGYLTTHPPPNLHHKTWLLWASLHLEGLMTPPERAQTIKVLLGLQREDGGWSLPALGDWRRQNGEANDKHAPSDGYATGLVLYVLQQAGVPATQDPIRRGVNWLRTNQRASGSWFTRSLNADRAHYITHVGTAFAVMALKASDALDK
jgi:squalene-hopene/tetraprenyl-beta-curcumene cyclase